MGIWRVVDDHDPRAPADELRRYRKHAQLQQGDPRPAGPPRHR
jgi:hypothetical protein